jgi:predicted DNA-binding transcriptional regulator AlpA
MEQINGWITSGEACERLKIARRTLYHLHRQSPDFPKPKKIGRTLL